MKKCFKCGRIQPRSEFYRHSAMGDGLLGKCKTCTKADSNARREAKIEECKEYDRQRANLPHRVAARQAYAKSDRGKERDAASSKAWIGRNSEKRQCHIILNNALANGRIIRQSCKVCDDPKSETHHEDYSKPLDVEWLCHKHHAQLHKDRRGDKGYESTKHKRKSDGRSPV